jgi:hypothetical protein
MAPHGAPDSLLCDRIEEWHQRNPGNTEAQLFYGIVAKSPGSAAMTHALSQRHSQRHPVAPHRIHPHTSSKELLPAQQRDPPPHLIQLTAAIHCSAHQEPPQSSAPTPAPAHVAAKDLQGPRAAETVSKRILETPVIITQRELCALAPDVWAQAASATEHKRDEPVALAMLGEVLSDHFEPEATAIAARRLRPAQIADEDAATALALSQPSALLNQPFPSDRTNPSHPKQSQPPKRPADEPRVALQQAATKASQEGAPEVAPPPIQAIRTPIATEATPAPPATAEAIPSLAIAAEATPAFVVAAEAPLPLNAAAQQQSALSPFPSLPFAPFSSLLTIYHCRAPISIPDSLRHSLQPLQR